MNNIKLYVAYLYLWPHILTHLFSSNRNLISQDVESFLNHRGYKNRITSGRVRLLIENRWYRNLFYIRIGRISYIIKWYLKGDPTFHPCRNMRGHILPTLSLHI